MAGLIIGFILGIIGSLIAWFVTAGFLTPKIEIREIIEARYFQDRNVRYRFAVRNRRIFRDAHDVTIRVRGAFRPHDRTGEARPPRTTFSLPVDDEWVPVIRSRWYWRRRTTKSIKTFWPQLPTIMTEQIPLWVTKYLPKDTDGELDLHEFLEPENHGVIRLIVIAYDSWSGTKKLFIRRFNQSDIRKQFVASRDPNDAEQFIIGYL